MTGTPSRPSAADPVPVRVSPPGRSREAVMTVGRLRAMVVAFPVTAERLLTARRVPDTMLLHGLRAEALIRLGRIDDARTEAAHAVEAASEEEPVEAARLLPVATVAADVEVLAGSAEAQAACANLTGLAVAYSDVDRLTVGACLNTVAVYHQSSCQHALALLARIAQTIVDPRAAGAVDAARSAITATCRNRRDTSARDTSVRDTSAGPRVHPLLTAGGLVRPSLTADFLPDRIRRWPGTHGCAATTARGRRDD